MFSLRTRLTFSYAVLVAVVLGTVVLVATRFAFELIARPTIDATEAGYDTARLIIANRHDASVQEVEALIVREVRKPRVDVRIISRRFRPGPGTRIVLGAGNPGSPPEPGPSPPGGQPPGGAGGREFGDPGGPPGAPGPPRRNWWFLDPSKLLGLPFHSIRFGGDVILISPDLSAVNDAIARYLETLGIGIGIALILSWLIARWITAQAIRPLITVTAELRRFAQGDFSPNHLTTNDRDELGALIAAYNGAAAKVAAAFEERLRLEEHMRRFVADAGHELRTPLTVVGGYLEILRKAAPNDLVVRERSLRMLDAQSARMRALVERLMALVRMERPEPTQPVSVDIVAIARDAVAAVVGARGGDVTLEGDETLRVLADAGDIHEAIGNLVDNAVKYGAGTPVRVDIRTVAGEVVVRVHDGGPGIPPGERAHVFERFFRGESRAATDGSGLGLAIVERAVARSRGSVRLEAADPGNTVVAIRLPLERSVQREAAML